MATALQLISRSLRRIGVLQSGETPEAADAQDALAILNDMLHGWEIEGIPLNHIDYALTDTIPHPPSHIKAIIYNLAGELAIEYEIQITPSLAALANQTFSALVSLYSKDDSELNIYANSY